MEIQEVSNVGDAQTALANQTFSSAGLLLDFNKVRAMQDLAEIMAKAVVAVPQHFRGKPGDCLAVIMQAAQWGMNPFAVAQKTHVVNGQLGYEAQLVNAVVQTSGAITGNFQYEYRGEGSKVECRVGAVLRGQSVITWGEWLSADSVTTKNSPLWKTNPKQQLGYLQVKNWARLHTPGAILGVYSTDELAEGGLRDMGAAEVVSTRAARQTELPAYTEEAFRSDLENMTKAITSGKKTPDQIIAMVATKYAIPDEIKDQIRAIANPPKDEAQIDVVDAEFVAAIESAEENN